MPGCSVKRCGNNSSKRIKDENGLFVTYHQFPSNRERRRDWVNRLRENGKMNKDGTLWEPNHNAKICSVHFEERFIDRNENSGRPLTMLSSNAVPTIFPIIKEKKSPANRGRVSEANRAANEQMSNELETIISVLKENGLDSEVTVTNTGTQYLLPEHVVTSGSMQCVFVEQPPQYVLPESGDNTEVHDMLAQAIEGANIEFVENAEYILQANSDLLDLDNVHQEENQQTEAPPPTVQLVEGQQERSKKMATLPTEDGGKKFIFMTTQGHQVATKIVPNESYQAAVRMPDFQASSLTASAQVAMSSRTTGTAQPFKPGDEKAGSSTDEDEDAAGACCQKFLEKPKDEKMDLSRDFRETLERLQHIQSELLKQVPAQQLSRFGSLVQQLSAEGKSVLQSLAFITLQVSEMKRVRIPTSQEENLEDGEAESQRRRVDEVGDLLQADLTNVLDNLDPATMNAMMVSTDFDVLLALNSDYSVASLEENFSHL